MNAQVLGIEPPKVGLRDRSSPMCTLSQHGYGAWLLKPKFCIDTNDKPHDWSCTCLWARTMNMNFELVPHVCYDTGNAVLEYGHRPRPQILHVVKKARQQAQKHLHQTKVVQQVCSGTGKYGPSARRQNLPGGHTCP